MNLVDHPTEPGLIFDCDGTLADTMPLHFLSWQRTMTKYGIALSEDRFYALAGQPTLHIIRTLLREQSLTGDAEAMSEEKDNCFLDLLPQVKPIEPIVAIAREYRDKCRMGVGSGSSRHAVNEVLSHLGLAGFFDAIVAAEDTADPKPAPDVFLRVAEQIGVAPTDCRVYEDADLGLEAARRAGMSSFAIRTVFTPQRIS